MRGGASLAARTAAALLLLASAGLSQTGKLGENCDLAILGQTDTKSFLAFDAELRYALKRPDPAAVALLVAYPLRVNDDLGSWYVHDAASLAARFQRIFGPALVAAVLDNRPEALSCSSEGVMYDNGTLWVNFVEDGAQAKSKIARFEITVVNKLSEGDSPERSPAGKVKFVCRTDAHRIIVDLGADGSPHYRAWNIPRPISDKPDLEIAKGVERVEGTGACGHAIWTFVSGKAKFVISEIGCFGDSPPQGARGQLQVFANGEFSRWCY
jgi:hypothetical protein